MGLDLADEQHRVSAGDSKVRRLPRGFHQRVHDGAGALHKVCAPQKGRADPERPGTHVPGLRLPIELDDAPCLQRRQNAVGRRRRLLEPVRQFRQRHAS